MEYVRRGGSAPDGFTYTVRIDDRDAEVLVASLDHLFCVRGGYFDRVYRGWVGADQEALEALSETIGALAQSQRRELTLARRDMMVLLRCTSELSNGLAPPDWEFATLFGMPRTDVRAVLHQLHDILIAGSRKPQEPG